MFQHDSKVQKTISFCFVKYAAGCCLHLFKRRDIFTARIEFHRVTLILLALNFREIHTDLQFSLGFSPNTLDFASLLITHIQIFIRYFVPHSKRFVNSKDNSAILLTFLFRSMCNFRNESIERPYLPYNRSVFAQQHRN